MDRLTVSAGNRSLLGPFNNIKSYFTSFQYMPDSSHHQMGLIINSEREGDLIRWNRVHGQYSYGLRITDNWNWKIGAALGFYNLVLEGTTSTGSLSAWALRNGIGTSVQYRNRHQLALVWQDIGNPQLYYGVRYQNFIQTMVQSKILAHPMRELDGFYFNRLSSEGNYHDIGWQLKLPRIYLGIGHLARFKRGNSFLLSTDVPLQQEKYNLQLQFIYNSPLFSKLTADLQSIEIRLHLLFK